MHARRRRGRLGVKVFSTTRDRDRLGEEVTAWLARERVVVLDVVVTQSSDLSFHCLSITVFFLAP